MKERVIVNVPRWKDSEKLAFIESCRIPNQGKEYCYYDEHNNQYIIDLDNPLASD
jgi:hypothetical protein